MLALRLGSSSHFSVYHDIIRFTQMATNNRYSCTQGFGAVAVLNLAVMSGNVAGRTKQVIATSLVFVSVSKVLCIVALAHLIVVPGLWAMPLDLKVRTVFINV